LVQKVKNPPFVGGEIRECDGNRRESKPCSFNEKSKTVGYASVFWPVLHFLGFRLRKWSSVSARRHRPTVKRVMRGMSGP